ncbi:MAG: zinc ribbon domain-containing protein [Planctomycetota bacterium]
MPLYRYRCDSCRHGFEELMSAREAEVATAVRCPQCNSDKTERELTTFAVRGDSASEASAEPFCGRCGENRPPCGA